MSDLPFLKLVQCYVLEVIDELPPSNREALLAMEPSLQKTYHGDGHWYEIVAQEMGFNEDFAEQICVLWKNNSRIAERSGELLTPIAFADMFLRHNFPYMFDKQR